MTIKNSITKTLVINLNSHYYCNLIQESLPEYAEYVLLEDFDLKKLFYSPFKSHQNVVHGWGKSRPSNLFKISYFIFKNSPLFTKKNTYIICHRIFDHFIFILFAIIFRIKPIMIFHGRCEVSTVKFIYSIKFFISGVLSFLEKHKLLVRYFIHEESKMSYKGKTGIFQRPTVLNSMNIKPKFSISSKCLIVGNYFERPVFSHEILEYTLRHRDIFEVYGASKKYNILSLSREDLINAYRDSFAYVSILKEPEVYYSLGLLDACDAKLPIFCLAHKMMPKTFKDNVIVYFGTNDLIEKIQKLKQSKVLWEKYSKSSEFLLSTYFSKSQFKNTWTNLLK